MWNKGKIQGLKRNIHLAAISLDDEHALESIELFPVWVFPYSYQQGDRVRHNGVLYRCLQAHTAQEDWPPDATPALWTVVSLEEWPEWVQPTGAHDAYDLGAKVTHNGSRWISTMDANVFEPGVYGWDEAQA